jgi:hypothetical protein
MRSPFSSRLSDVREFSVASFLEKLTDVVGQRLCEFSGLFRATKSYCYRHLFALAVICV